ncbi:MAG: DUF3501 family protein [Alphaproteobacteria bacterium]|nr:DUF3501 family protein [Alphaproteobacteria bacterium]
MSATERRITPADILDLKAYEAVRAEKRRAVVALKKNRRVEVGPYATFYFENYETMWMQVQEMLRIEKGGADQLEGELAAYNPLIPQGAELVATMMLEIDDPLRRANVLARLGGIEETIFLEIDGARIAAEWERDVERTNEEGKASSVHFLHFRFSPEHVAAFKRPEARAILGTTHENYAHMAVLAPAVRAELAKDFA